VIYDCQKSRTKLEQIASTGGGVSPVTIASAAVIMQFSVISIMLVAMTLRWATSSTDGYRNSLDRPFSTETETKFETFVSIMFALATLGALLFSASFKKTWEPILGGARFTG
jgi:hypothetical protein